MSTFTSGAGYYTLILNANEVGGSADVGSNTSKVSWSLQMRADGAYCQWNPGPGDFEVRINGALVWSAQNPSLWYGGMGGTLTLASGTTTVGHNSDGSKTVYCEGKYIANSSANYLPTSSTCGGNLTLTTIPRASSFASISGSTIGGSQTINIDRKSSAFTHNLWYRIGSGSWVSIGTGIATSKTWTLPKSLNNEIPNATSLTLTYLLRTYNGGSQIGGDVTYNFKVNYSGEKPTAGSVSITYASLFNNKFIANYSSATIKYSGYGGVYGSTVKSAQVIFNGSWKGSASYSTGKLTAGTHTYQGVVTDSRNNSSYAAQQSFTCYQINNPSVSINAYRSDSAGNANPSGTYITIIPTYSAHNPVGGNSIKSNSFTCTSLMTTGTAISSGAKKILSGAAVDSEYIISGTVTDQLGRSSATSVKIGTAFAIWDVRPDEKGMAFGKYSTGPDQFEVAWDAYFDKSVYLSENIPSRDKIGSPISGAIKDDSVTTLANRKSFIGSFFSDTWYSIISARHRNGASDGKDFGLLLYSSLTAEGPIYRRKQLNGTWGNAVQMIDSSNILDKVYPVGSVYISVVNKNPGTFIGGTWVTFGQGRTLVGVNTSDSDFNTVGKTGGSKYLQKHTHSANTSWPYAQINTGSTYGHTTGGSWIFGSVGSGVSVSNTGSGDSENLQPYITVYFWKRTA